MHKGLSPSLGEEELKKVCLLGSLVSEIKEVFLCLQLCPIGYCNVCYPSFKRFMQRTKLVFAGFDDVQDGTEQLLGFFGLALAGIVPVVLQQDLVSS